MIPRAMIVLAVAAAASGCAPVRTGAGSHGIARCPASASAALLSADALECWFDAPHGRWRTLSSESHFDVLVVRVEAADTRDAGDIARRFVAGAGGEFSEILVYVQPETHAGSPSVRRARWTRGGGMSVMEFSSAKE